MHGRVFRIEVDAADSSVAFQGQGTAAKVLLSLSPIEVCVVEEVVVLVRSSRIAGTVENLLIADGPRMPRYNSCQPQVSKGEGQHGAPAFSIACLHWRTPVHSVLTARFGKQFNGPGDSIVS